MGKLVNFPGHKRMRCPTECGMCLVCCLYCCTRCGGAEASLPTDCPGYRMSIDDIERVQDGHYDFSRHHGWIVADRRIGS